MAMSSMIPKVADFVQKATIAGLVTVTVLGMHGAYQASAARIDLARRVKEQIQAREQELIAERIAREKAEGAAMTSSPSS